MESNIQELLVLNSQLIKLQARIDNVKAEIENELPETGFKNEFITISRKASSTSTSIDLKALEKKEPELYNDLLNDYTKTTERKASVSYSFKK